MSGSVAWADLERQSEAVADRLRDSGVPRGGVVAVDAPASFEAAAAILGIVRAGAVAAPLPVDRTWRENAAAMRLLDPLLVLGRETVVHPGRTLDAPGVVVLTSGTTAAPKGVVLSETALAASATAWLAALPPATGWLLALGLAHVAGSASCGGAAGVGCRSGSPRPATRRPQLAALARNPRPATFHSYRRSSPACSTPSVTRHHRRASRRAPRRRLDPADARDPRTRRWLAGRPDVRPERGGLRRDGAGDGRRHGRRRRAPDGRSPAFG